MDTFLKLCDPRHRFVTSMLSGLNKGLEVCQFMEPPIQTLLLMTIGDKGCLQLVLQLNQLRTQELVGVSLDPALLLQDRNPLTEMVTGMTRLLEKLARLTKFTLKQPCRFLAALALFCGTFKLCLQTLQVKGFRCQLALKRGERQRGGLHLVGLGLLQRTRLADLLFKTVLPRLEFGREGSDVVLCSIVLGQGLSKLSLACLQLLKGLGLLNTQLVQLATLASNHLVKILNMFATHAAKLATNIFQRSQS